MSIAKIKVGQRPKSLCQVVSVVNSGHEFGPALAEFLDEAKQMDANSLELAMAINPGKLHQDNSGYGSWQDAYLAATAEHLARAADIPIPVWTEQSDRFLSRAWFDNHGLKSLNAMMVAESPLAFRRRFIFTEARPLRRA